MNFIKKIKAFLFKAKKPIDSNKHNKVAKNSNTKQTFINKYIYTYKFRWH